MRSKISSAARRAAFGLGACVVIAAALAGCSRDMARDMARPAAGPGPDAAAALRFADADALFVQDGAWGRRARPDAQAAPLTRALQSDPLLTYAEIDALW